MAPVSPTKDKSGLSLQMPPPLLHARSAMELRHSQPQTPIALQTGNDFTSPYATPQGSPSKSKMPPGALDLPGAFENAMSLDPNFSAKTNMSSSPTKAKPVSPTRAAIGRPAAAVVGAIAGHHHHQHNEERMGRPDYSLAGAASTIGAGPSPSPSRRMGKENIQSPTSTATGFRAGKVSTPNQAALSRQEQYAARDNVGADSGVRARFNPQRGLTPEELEKLQSPKVRRLANVTQLYFLDYYFDLLSYVHHRQNRQGIFDKEFPAPPASDPVQYEAARTKYLGRERANLRKRRTRLRQGDFQILTQVGQGGYGQVFLAAKKDTREVCALKVMSKKLLFKLDEVRHILTERDILTAAKSEWLVKLLYSFQDEKSIYLAMEYVPGGDFRTLLNNLGVLHNRHSRFYIAEMFCCVDALHQLGYIHRDLKPENFLIDATGHVKLTDFGLAAGMLAPQKFESMRIKLEEVSKMTGPYGAGPSNPMDQRSAAERREGYRHLRDREVNYAKSIVGSPDYMAPEVLKGETYDFTVDYWSLGCMLYEALAGYPPFAGSTVDETWQNLKQWQSVLKKPKFDDPGYYLSGRTWDLITRCVTARKNRFRSIQEIYKHHYFSEVDWAKLRTQRAPFVPELEGETDAGYFDDFENEADMAKYKEVHEKQTALEKMADRDEQMSKNLFVGFTFRHRKPATEVTTQPTPPSPQKTMPTDGPFGTMF